jgi:hypothetical protein
MTVAYVESIVFASRHVEVPLLTFLSVVEVSVNVLTLMVGVVLYCQHIQGCTRHNRIFAVTFYNPKSLIFISVFLP